MQGILKLKIREAKDNYRRTLENKLKRNNMRDVWSGMRAITGFQRTGSMGLEGRVYWASELMLCDRFDTVAPLSQDSPQLPLYLPLLFHLTDLLSASHHLN